MNADNTCIDLIDPLELPYEVYILRIGHRPERDKRVTSHIALVARAFGCKGFILGDTNDSTVIETIRKVIQNWGGRYFKIDFSVNSVSFIKHWKRQHGEGSCIIHLTMYGMPINSSIKILKNRCRKILLIVGAEKVPREIYSLADYNISIGLQPHSEISALAVFLDRLFSGTELCLTFPDAKITIVPNPRGKEIISRDIY